MNVSYLYSLSRFLIAVFFPLLLTVNISYAEKPIIVAVASNFVEPMREIQKKFEVDTDFKVKISSGSSGKMAAQIMQGAPFDVFLSADQAKPQWLYQQGLAETPFTYAKGVLVLWSANPLTVDDQGTILMTHAFHRLAMANPKLAPYGRAAESVLLKLNILSLKQPNLNRHRIVSGENVAQTFQFIASGNADVGLVAQSQVLMKGQLRSGSYWKIPVDWYAPILQDATLLTRAKEKPAARAFVEYLRAESTRQLIQSFGYSHHVP